MIDIFTVTGSRYDMGFATGKHFKSYLQSAIGKYEDSLGSEKSRKFAADMEKTMSEMYPECLDEIHGRADGAGVSRDALMLMYSPEFFRGTDGCTTVYMKNRNGNMLFSHNEDNTNYNKKTVALIKYDFGDHWVVGYTHAEKLAGSAFSWNSYGMVFSCNYIFDPVRNLDYPSRYTVIRSILEARNMEEAIDMFRACKSASAFSFNIVDKKTMEAANVEKDLSGIYVKRIDDRFGRANHFVVRTENCPEPMQSSAFRNAKSNELVNKLERDTVTIDDLRNVLAYESDDYYASILKSCQKYDPEKCGSDLFANKSVTVANFAFDGENDIVKMIDYIDNGELTWKYGEFIPNCMA